MVKRPANRRKLLVRKSDEPETHSDSILATIRKSVLEAVRKDATADAAQTAGFEKALAGAAALLAPYRALITDDDIERLEEAAGINDADASETGNPTDPQAPADSVVDTVQPVDPVADVPLQMAKPDGVPDAEHQAGMVAAKNAYKATVGTKRVAKSEAEPVAKSEDSQSPEQSETPMETKDGLDLSAFSAPQQQQMQAIFKSHDDLIKAHSTVLDQNKALIQKSEDLEKRLAVQEQEKVLKSCESELAELQHLGMSVSEMAPILKSLREFDAEKASKLVAVLKSVNEQMRHSRDSGNLYGEIGSSLSPEVDSPEDKLEKLVDSYVAKSDCAGKSREQVYSMVLRTSEGARLYALSDNRRMNAGRA